MSTETAPNEPRSATVVAVVATSGLCMALGLASLFVGTFPLFLGPVSRDLHWGAAIFPQALAIAGLSSALSGPIVGALTDRLGVRMVLLCGIALWSAALFAMSFLSGSIVQLYVFAVLLGVLGGGCGPVALSKLVSERVNRGRGLALGIALSAAPAIGTALAVVVAHGLINAIGWRQSYQVLGAAILVIAGPPMAIILMRTRRGGTVSSSFVPELDDSLTLRQAIRSREFWAVAGFTALACGSINGMVGHFLPWSAERGISDGIATAALSAFSLAGPVGPLLAGVLADKFADARVLALLFLLPLLGFCLALFAPPAMIVPALALLGMGFSAATGLTPILTTRYFGLRYSAQIFGVLLGFSSLMIGLGPVLLGMARDRLGVYQPAMPVLLAVTAAAAVIGLCLPRYRFAPPTRAAPPAGHSIG